MVRTPMQVYRDNEYLKKNYDAALKDFLDLLKLLGITLPKSEEFQRLFVYYYGRARRRIQAEEKKAKRRGNNPYFFDAVESTMNEAKSGAYDVKEKEFEKLAECFASLLVAIQYGITSKYLFRRNRIERDTKEINDSITKLMKILREKGNPEIKLTSTRNRLLTITEEKRSELPDHQYKWLVGWVASTISV